MRKLVFALPLAAIIAGCGSNSGGSGGRSDAIKIVGDDRDRAKRRDGRVSAAFWRRHGIFRLGHREPRVREVRAGI